jgi:subtilisin family serine protease
MKCARALTGGAILLLVLAAGAQGRTGQQHAGRAEIVVRLAAPALAEASGSRAAAAARIAREQARFSRALHTALPSARIRWRYRLVLNGLAVVLAPSDVTRLRTLPGVRDVSAGAHYATERDVSATAPSAAGWLPGLPNQGEGIKIGIIDDGVDQAHPYFDPASYSMPAGFPKGQRAYTTAKVIVARAFPPPGATWKNAGKPFDPVYSGHATHVAGIAAGNAGTTAAGGRVISGVAPRAYIGNYKALTVPTDAGVGLDGNAAEIVAAIEAAVADGMNVINLSIGEPEVEPSRDLVAIALDAAAAAGVVPVVAAGNDFDEFGPGSLASPGNSAQAITVAAVASGNGDGPAGELASFSSAGPTPISLRLKPDVSAPGISILSSIPGGWATMSGTSMATPHVAGAAALLLERHPSWTVAQVKAARVSTGDPTSVTPGSPAPPTRGGGGLIDLPRADVPLVLATPASVSFGLIGRGAPVPAPASVTLEDAGGGAGTWTVAVETSAAPAGAGLSVPATVEVPGTLALTPTMTADAQDGEVTGFVTLSRGTDVRRIPFWFRATQPRLLSAPSTRLRRSGAYTGDTRGKAALVSTYRYPDVPSGGEIKAPLAGPEQLFRVVLTAPAANFGVVITHRERGVKVEPRVIAGADENRLTGYAALPINLNPYVSQFGQAVLAAGAVRPLAGSYDIVFDSATAAGAGRFSFRFWINDTTPPSATLETVRVRRGESLRVRVADAGSGVDVSTITVRIDGRPRSATVSDGVVQIPTSDLKPGRRGLRLQVSDYQESRNMENVPPILPNTRVLTAVVRIAPRAG